MRGIETSAAILPFRKSDINLPDAGRLISALRHIGYSLEQAIADLIDNSINADAKNVLIRFLHDGESIKAVAVVDDGSGMGDDELHDAMRFGSQETAALDTLSKFGMGMKLASLSHAQTLTVMSRSSGRTSGRRWTLEGIREGWWCEKLQSDIASDIMDRKWGPLNLNKHGTVVMWEDLDKLPSHRRGLKYTLTNLETRLRLHLGLCFHRFLERGSFRIHIDQIYISRRGQGLSSEISPLNPFGYPESGHCDYPKMMTAKLSGVGPLKLQAHIWPAKNESAEYKLGRRSAARQGFYFYRNDRLIQAGGWNGLVHDETEPHSSLARIKVDLPSRYDSDFGINVQKAAVLVPPVFAETLDAHAKDGTSFENFRRDAIHVYRSANSVRAETGQFPSSGLDSAVLVQLRQLYGRKGQDNGYAIRWSKLRADEAFRIEADNHRILVNREFKSSNSSESIKVLLSILLRKEFDNGFSRARQKELDAVNNMMLQTMKRDTV